MQGASNQKLRLSVQRLYSDEVFVVSGLLLNFNQGLVERHTDYLLDAVNPNLTGNAVLKRKYSNKTLKLFLSISPLMM